MDSVYGLTSPPYSLLWDLMLILQWINIPVSNLISDFKWRKTILSNKHVSLKNSFAVNRSKAWGTPVFGSTFSLVLCSATATQRTSHSELEQNCGHVVATCRRAVWRAYLFCVPVDGTVLCDGRQTDRSSTERLMVTNLAIFINFMLVCPRTEKWHTQTFYTPHLVWKT